MSVPGPRRVVVVAGTRVVTIASSPQPRDLGSNVGHPTDPAVIGVALPVTGAGVTISEGSGHLGSGAAFRLEEVLTASGGLQARWTDVFARADAVWAVPLLARLAADRLLGEHDIVEAYRRHHGTSPTITVTVT